MTLLAVTRDLVSNAISAAGVTALFSNQNATQIGIAAGVYSGIFAVTFAASTVVAARIAERTSLRLDEPVSSIAGLISIVGSSIICSATVATAIGDRILKRIYPDADIDKVRTNALKVLLAVQVLSAIVPSD